MVIESIIGLAIILLVASLPLALLAYTLYGQRD